MSASTSNYRTSTYSSIKELKSLIDRGESKSLEFKLKVSSPEKIARELCAFANTDGGILLIGVADDGNIFGVRDYNEEEWLLSKAAHELCSPEVDYHLQIIPWQHTEVLLAHIPPSEKKPVYVYSNGKRHAYTRIKDESVVASEQMIEILKQQTKPQGVTFEYGDNERQLFTYLRSQGRITVDQYAKLIHQTTFRASTILVGLVSAGILMLYTQNQTEYFTFASESN